MHRALETLLLLVAAVSVFAQEMQSPFNQVVRIRAEVDGVTRTGAGFVVRVDASSVYIVTAAHVVSGDKHPKVEFYAKRNELVDAQALRLDAQTDVALLRVDGQLPADLTPLKFGSAKAMNMGDALRVIGFPQGAGAWALTNASFSGKKNALLTLSGVTEEGNSGGPVLRDNALVGMVTEQRAPFAYAVSADALRELVAEWGIMTQSADEIVDGTQAAALPQIIAGAQMSCELDRAGAARCWGNTALDGTAGWYEDINLTQQLGFIALGGMHLCGLWQGEAYCMGSGRSGQLGNNNEENSYDSLAAVQGDIKFAQLSAGGWHTCGLTATGKAYCWGANDNGRLGDGSNKARSQPTSVTGNRRYKSIAAGLNHTCAVDATGDAYCWGGVYGLGAPGFGGASVQAVPTKVASEVKFVRVAAGDSWSCALTNDGRAFCWGITDETKLWGPSEEDAMLRFTSISVGAAHVCALTAAGKAYCWGDNGSGQLGNGNEEFSAKPSAVASELSFASISAGVNHTCATTTDAAFYCWGGNYMKQINAEETQRFHQPVRVK